MVELAGPDSVIDWAEHVRRSGGRPGWRWPALAPVRFPGCAVAHACCVAAVRYDRLGRRCHCRSDHRARARVCASWPRFTFAPSCRRRHERDVARGSCFGFKLHWGNRLALTEPRGAWVVVLVVSFITVFRLASSISHRLVSSRLDEVNDVSAKMSVRGLPGQRSLFDGHCYRLPSNPRT